SSFDHLLSLPHRACTTPPLCLSLSPLSLPFSLFFFFFNDTATTEIYTLSLHDALPICRFLHYGQWIGEKPPTAQQRVRLAIVEALGKKPADFPAFLRLMEESGFAVKHGRGGVISFLAPEVGRASCRGGG